MYQYRKLLSTSLEKHFSRGSHGDLNTTWSQFDRDVREDLLKYRGHYPEFFNCEDSSNESQLLACVHTQALETLMRSDNQILFSDVANGISLDAWTDSKKKLRNFEALRGLMAPNAINNETATNFNKIFDLPSVYELNDIDNSQYSERVFAVRDFNTRDFMNDDLDSTPRCDFSINILIEILQ